jgi:hypothetical protein
MAVANGVWRIDSISPEQWGVALAGAPCWVTYYDSFQPIRRFLKPGAIRYLRQQSDDTHTIGLYGKSLTKTQEHSQPTQQTDPPFLGESCHRQRTGTGLPIELAMDQFGSRRDPNGEKDTLSFVCARYLILSRYIPVDFPAAGHYINPHHHHHHHQRCWFSSSLVKKFDRPSPSAVV